MPALIVGILPGVVEDYDGSTRSPRISRMHTAGGLNPWQRIDAPEHLRETGITIAMLNAILDASPLPYETGTDIHLHLLDRVEVIAVILDLIDGGAA